MRSLLPLIGCVLLAAALPAQDDVADVPSQDLRAGKDENKRYFLIGPAKGQRFWRAGMGWS
jgi:hypothetical protein